jgi:hypothetical protein
VGAVHDADDLENVREAGVAEQIDDGPSTHVGSAVPSVTDEPWWASAQQDGTAATVNPVGVIR